MHRVRRWLSRRIGYPAFIYGRGLRVHDCVIRARILLEEKRRLCRVPREQLLQRQIEMLRRLLVHAGRTAPFYRRRFKEADFDPKRLQSLDDLAGIPPLTKSDIRGHLEELVSETFDRRQLIQAATGGSTGVPVRLYTDREAWLHYRVSAFLSDEDAGWGVGDPFVLLWGASFEVAAGESLLGRLCDTVRNRIILDTYKLDEHTMADYHARLSRFRPSVLVGYTSSLLAMAGWLDRHGIRPSYPTTSIINAAETLQPWQRERMQDVYGAPVFDRYGSRDCGLVAMECEAHNGLHTNIIDLVVEPYGGRQGEPQEVLITNLNAYGMPLIRYSIGDMAVFGDRACPCGRTTPLLERVMGRVTDMIHLPGDKLLPGEFFTRIARSFPIAEYQVVQEEDHSLTFRIVRDEGYGSRDEQRIREIVAEHVQGLPVSIEYVDAIDRTRTGKLRPVISKVAAQRAARRDAT